MTFFIDAGVIRENEGKNPLTFVGRKIIDDKINKTIISATSNSKKDSKKKKADMSLDVANNVAKKALEKKIKNVYFDS